jgi:hypothetical protein
MKIKGLMFVMMITFSGAALWAQSPRAFVRSVQGTVEIKAPGAGAWQPAAAGQELERETLVSTGFKSMAVLSVGDSTLTVRPLTRLSLGELQTAAEAEKVDIQLRTGRIRANVKAPPGGKIDFTVRSPIATASVRGTAFDFDTLNLSVDEGTVVFSGADNTAVYVAAGQTSFPDPVSGKTAPPMETVSVSAASVLAGTEDVAVPGISPVLPAPAPEVPPTDEQVDIEINWN